MELKVSKNVSNPQSIPANQNTSKSTALNPHPVPNSKEISQPSLASSKNQNQKTKDQQKAA